MHRKYFWWILALALFCLALILSYFLAIKPTVIRTTENIQTDKSPYSRYINGVGVVEPSSGNIMISTPFNRIVKRVHVAVNDDVKEGDILLELDNQDLLANLHVKQTEYAKALSNLQKLRDAPRKEDLAIAIESVKKATVMLDAAKMQYTATQNLPTANSISKEEQDSRLYKYQHAEASLRESQAEFEKIKAGTWEPDLVIAAQNVAQAQAEVGGIETEIERTYIKAPIDGTVLQIKIHDGEISSPDPSKALMILGNVNAVNLRVSIDQYNAVLINKNQPAVAFRQGDHNAEFPLEFLHAEPMMVPKKYLTNAANEKVDTQVLEILYRITRKDAFLVIGEQMDVFIEKK